MICVYPADCTDFSTNGNGTISPLTAEVTETLNGEYELTVVHQGITFIGFLQGRVDHNVLGNVCQLHDHCTDHERNTR